MSTRLFVDAGNTRVKWSLEKGAAVIAQGSLSHRDREDWTTPLSLVQRPREIWVGSVGGERLRLALTAWAEAGDLPAPRFVAVEKERLGLKVAYADVSRLGVDRFLALLGARARYRGAVCVADVGTALTLDAVAADGTHLGGLIAPGPATMVDSILRGTAQIADSADAPPETPFARDTGEAVNAGARYAAAALIDRIANESAARLDGHVTLLITGGGRFDLLPLIRSAHTPVPDLVLHGLRVLADDLATTVSE